MANVKMWQVGNAAAFNFSIKQQFTSYCWGTLLLPVLLLCRLFLSEKQHCYFTKQQWRPNIKTIPSNNNSSTWIPQNMITPPKNTQRTSERSEGSFSSSPLFLKGSILICCFMVTSKHNYTMNVKHLFCTHDKHRTQ